MKTVKEKRSKSNVKDRVAAYTELVGGDCGFDSRLLLIQQLIPIGLMAVEEALQEEVSRMVGERHSREGSLNRWGSNPGSVFLGNQKLSVQVPRVRDTERNQEMELASYRQLQSPKIVDERVFAQVLNGISTRKYEIAVGKVPETFGISKSSVSRKFIEASARKLKELSNRDLGGDDIVAVFMDGKSFAENEMISALGVTMEGRKTVLGMVESHTENHRVCREFLQGLKDRGLRDEHKLLFIIDGAKGLRKGIQEVFGKQALIQRCQWHKRENVTAYLPKSQQGKFRKKLQKAYQQDSYKSAKKTLMAIRKELSLLNQSAVNSLDEGLEETLTLHRLRVFDHLGVSLKTTNAIASINSRLEHYTHRVTCWKNSSQRQRWVATALLEIEPSLRKIKGYKHLQKLRSAMNACDQQQMLANAA